MLTLAQIKEYKALAAQHPGNVSSKIITHLLGELQEARSEIIKLRSEAIDRRGPYTDHSIMPIGKQYKGEPLELVPDDYLRWWITQPDNSNREGIETDVRFASYPEKAFAIQRLKLYDYTADRLKLNRHNGNWHTNGHNGNT
jgi:hypothetical protein